MSPKKSPKVYLAGSIQDSRDLGVGWRDKVTPKLEAIGITVLDPTKSEANLGTGDGTISGTQDCLNGWLASGNIELFREHMRKVREDDLRMVHDSDFLIVYLDFNRKIGGTIVEIHEAFINKIPIYAVCYDPKKDWNHWLLSTILDGGELFDSWGALLDSLEQKYMVKK